MSNTETSKIDKFKDNKLELPLELKDIIKKSENERFFFSNATKTVEDIDILYLLDKQSHQNVCSISSKFLVSSFTLNYLKIINKFVENKFKFHQLTLSDFVEFDKIQLIKSRIHELDDEPVIIWLRKECLEELKNALDNLDVDNINKLVELGHIINLLEKELLNIEQNDDIEMYDILYGYLRRLNNLDLSGATDNVACEVIEIKKTSTTSGEIIEFRAECKGDRNSRKDFKEYYIQKGNEIFSKW